MAVPADRVATIAAARAIRRARAARAAWIRSLAEPRETAEAEAASAVLAETALGLAGEAVGEARRPGVKDRVVKLAYSLQTGMVYDAATARARVLS